MKAMVQMMMMVMVNVMAISQMASAEPVIAIAKEEWELFKIVYNKKYDSIVEEQFRMKIFMENKLKVIEHNQLYAQNLTSFKMETNHLSDMLSQEVVSAINGLRGERNESQGSTYIPPDDDIELPSYVNWTQKGAVTAVKNQLQCGSCWAFSAVGSLEGQHARKTGHLVNLSEQDLVDCCHLCHGCNGGLMTLAFQCIMIDHGIDSEGYYPYKGYDDTCRFNSNAVAATVSGYANVIKGSEAALKKAVALIGPIAVGIDAGRSSFMHYRSGVYYEPSCSSTTLDHGVLVVGYGTERGRDYWLVKNSWSALWGDGGYIKMARNKGNMCGIATMASFPLV